MVLKADLWWMDKEDKRPSEGNTTSNRNVGCFPHAEFLKADVAGIWALSVCDTSVNCPYTSITPLTPPLLPPHPHYSHIISIVQKFTCREVISCSL